MPDTGHLAWAGADVAQMIRDYRDRITLLHVKDARLSVATQAVEAGSDYQSAVMDGLWVEPGRGELGLQDILAELPADFSGWYMVEVDRPDIRDPYESAVASARWMRSTFRLGTSAGTFDGAR